MGTTTKFVNNSGHMREVEMILANGTRDSINIQPGARVTPPAGSMINPDKEKSYLSSFLTVLVLPDGKTEDTGPEVSGETTT
jgi:hypothetical protein